MKKKEKRKKRNDVRMYGCSFFPPFLSYKIPTIHLFFCHYAHKYSLMNCVEKRFCESTAVFVVSASIVFRNYICEYFSWKTVTGNVRFMSQFMSNIIIQHEII